MRQRPAPHMLCMEKYNRSVPWLEYAVTLPCQHPNDHDGDHSWQKIMEADELAILGGKPDPELVMLDELLLKIECGDLDDYLESILAFAHQRKLTRRGRGVRRPERRR